MELENLLATGERSGVEGTELRKWVCKERIVLHGEMGLVREDREREVDSFNRKLFSCVCEKQRATSGCRTGGRRESGYASSASTGMKHTSPHELIPPFHGYRDEEPMMGKAEEGYTAQHGSCVIHEIQIQAEGTQLSGEVWQVQAVKVATVEKGADTLEFTKHGQVTLGISVEDRIGKLEDFEKVGDAKEFDDRNMHGVPDGPSTVSWRPRR